MFHRCIVAKNKTPTHFLILKAFENIFSGTTLSSLDELPDFTLGWRHPVTTRSQVRALQQQMRPSAAICPVKMSLNTRWDPYLFTLCRLPGQEFHTESQKRIFWKFCFTPHFWPARVEHLHWKAECVKVCDYSGNELTESHVQLWPGAGLIRR